MPLSDRWPTDVAVVIPTIRERRTARDVSIDQWRALGADPLIVEQPAELPLGHMSQLSTARVALRAGVDSGADLVVYAEDDIDLDPRLVDILPTCVGDSPVSLWHRPRFRPRRITPQAGQIIVCPAIHQRDWWGSMCVVATREQAERWAGLPDPEHGGIDMTLRNLGVRITVPALVEHRPGPRYASRTTLQVRSDTYQGPRHGW